MEKIIITAKLEEFKNALKAVQAGAFKNETLIFTLTNSKIEISFWDVDTKIDNKYQVTREFNVSTHAEEKFSKFIIVSNCKTIIKSLNSFTEEIITIELQENSNHLYISDGKKSAKFKIEVTNETRNDIFKSDECLETFTYSRKKLLQRFKSLVISDKKVSSGKSINNKIILKKNEMFCSNGYEVAMNIDLDLYLKNTYVVNLKIFDLIKHVFDNLSTDELKINFHSNYISAETEDTKMIINSTIKDMTFFDNYLEKIELGEFEIELNKNSLLKELKYLNSFVENEPIIIDGDNQKMLCTTDKGEFETTTEINFNDFNSSYRSKCLIQALNNIPTTHCKVGYINFNKMQGINMLYFKDSNFRNENECYTISAVMPMRRNK